MKKLKQKREGLKEVEAEKAYWMKVLHALEAVKPNDRSLYHSQYLGEVQGRVKENEALASIIRRQIAKTDPFRLHKKFFWKRFGFIKVSRPHKRLVKIADALLFFHNTIVHRSNRFFINNPQL